MPQKSVSQAILLLVLANLLASLSDVSLKVLNGEVPTFQYVFIRQLISLLFIFPLWIRLPKKHYKDGYDKITFWRAQFIVGGSACAMVAITHLTLATANAMFCCAFDDATDVNLSIKRDAAAQQIYCNINWIHWCINCIKA